MLFFKNLLSYLQDHAKGKKHQNVLLRVETLFKKTSRQITQDVDKSPSASCSGTTSKQTTLHTSDDTDSTKTGITWLLNLVASGYSVQKDDFLTAT